MIAPTKTCAECIDLILRRGGKWRNKQIEGTILKEYGLQFQNNTIAKFLSFAMKAGRVKSELIKLETGKMCDEYWYVQPDQKINTDSELMKRCLSAANTYPDDHPQREEIMKQYQDLKKTNDKI